jgi:DNA-binding NarL/FixJ family response regulator
MVQANPLTKLDLRDRTQAALRARQLGLAGRAPQKL